MKLKRLLVAAAIAASFGAAHADSGSFNVVNGVGTFTGAVAANGSFTDTWTFSLPDAVASGTAVVLSFEFVSSINFDSISLLQGMSVLSSATKSLDFPGFGGIETWTMTLPALAAGAYALELSGTKTGMGPATYFGAVEVTAVPEPETYALALAALGLFAVGSRLKRKV